MWLAVYGKMLLQFTTTYLLYVYAAGLKDTTSHAATATRSASCYTLSLPPPTIASCIRAGW